ncbi:MAG: trigger factor [Ignavibacteria bacterium]|nr:trigger factor [Ignavibacteria bacterium]
MILEVNVQTLSEVSREVEITTTAEELKPHFDKAYREFRPKADIRGFRKGKAPLDIVKKLYGDLIEHEALPEVAGILYKQAIEENDLKPIGEPVIVDMNYTRGEQFRVKIQYDVRPTIEVGKYKGVSIEKPVYTITDEHVEREIERLRRIHSTLSETDAVTDDEHVVSATLQEMDPSGVPLIGKNTQKARFYLADPKLEEPFHNALKASEKGGEYRVAFEDKHGDHTHTVNLKLTVDKIEKVTLPEFSSEFVNKITSGKSTDVEAFRKSIHDDLVSYWNERSRRQMIDALAAELLRIHEFQAPESLVRNVLESLLEEVKQQYPKKELPHGFDIGRFNEQNRAYAIYQSRWALLREELIKAEDLTAEESDLVAIAEREAPRMGIDKDRLLNYYKSSDQMKDRIVGDKLIELLLSHAKIKEVKATPAES